jgi:hypothetical protein
VQKALRLLLFRRGRKPGVRDWELEAKLGRGYRPVVERAGSLLSEIGLQLKEVVEESPIPGEEGARRFVVVLVEPPTAGEAKLSGWRIDTLAGLSATLGLVLARQGRAPRDEVEDLLAGKLGLWRAEALVDAYLRAGYLQEDSEGFIGLDWRTYAEVDLQQLIGRLQSIKPGEEGKGAEEEADEA